MPGVRLLVAKHRSLTTDRYVVSHCDDAGTEGVPWVSARVGRLLWRTRVRFDGAPAPEPGATEAAFSFGSRSAVDLGGGYEVHDPHGVELARFGRPRRRRLEVWLQAPGIDASGRPSRGEGSRGRLARSLGLPAPFSLDLVDHVTGEVVLGLRRLPGRRVRVLVEVADSRVDPRAAAAVTVGVVSVLSR